MNVRRVNVFALLMLGISGAISAATLPGMTYDSIKELPDFSGWWTLNLAGGPAVLARARGPAPPLKPELLPKFQARIALALSGGDMQAGNGPGFYCRPQRFSGTLQQGPEVDTEFLFTPGRITITNELGWVRRIEMDGRSLPDDPDESSMGTSVGRWQGQMLIVETVGLHSQALALLPILSDTSLGENARLIERFFLKDPNTLQIDAELTAPEIFTEPHKISYQLARDLGHVIREFTRCNDYDRAIDPVTGAQRFDMTPPADLPPPPAQ